jgi:hypothetical protein
MYVQQSLGMSGRVEAAADEGTIISAKRLSISSRSLQETFITPPFQHNLSRSASLKSLDLSLPLFFRPSNFKRPMYVSLLFSANYLYDAAFSLLQPCRSHLRSSHRQGVLITNMFGRAICPEKSSFFSIFLSNDICIIPRQ